MSRSSLSLAHRETYLRFSSLALPRYTSYPAIPHWRDQIRWDNKGVALSSYLAEGQSYSLYLHVPYCHRLCFYCGCQKEILNPASPAAQRQVRQYLDGLREELAALAPHFKKAVLAQIHVGGGTPNFLNAEQWEELSLLIRHYLPVSPDLSWSMEVDPRTLSDELLKALVPLGVKRLSLGVQDFDPRVQKAINRIQPYETVASLCNKARAMGIQALNFDLIYGLPFQTQESIEVTLEKVLQLRPERIAYYRLAVLPEMFVAQKNFAPEDLPEGKASMELNLLIQRRLKEAGYIAIGLDHFALPEDALAQASQAGTLQRNFQGMTTGRDLPLLGIGPSSISSMGDLSVQNPKTTKDWLAAIAAPATELKAHHLSEEDRLRKAIIDQIFCRSLIDVKEIESMFGPRASELIKHVAPELQTLAEEGLLAFGLQKRIELSEPLGRLLQRVVASLFDAYLPQGAYRNGLEAGRASSVG